MTDATHALLEKHPHLHWMEAAALVRLMGFLDALQAEMIERFHACQSADLISELAKLFEQLAANQTKESSLGDPANLVAEHSDTQADDIRELIEAIRAVADAGNTTYQCIEDMRRMFDNHLDVMQRRMDAKAANDSGNSHTRGKAA